MHLWRGDEHLEVPYSSIEIPISQHNNHCSMQTSPRLTSELLIGLAFRLDIVDTQTSSELEIHVSALVLRQRPAQSSRICQGGAPGTRGIRKSQSPSYQSYKWLMPMLTHRSVLRTMTVSARLTPASAHTAALRHN